MRQTVKRGTAVFALALLATAPLTTNAQAEARTYKCKDYYSKSSSKVDIKLQACSQFRGDTVDGLAVGIFENWSGVKVKSCYVDMTIYYLDEDDEWTKDVTKRNGCYKAASSSGQSRAARSSSDWGCGDQVWIKAYARVDYNGGNAWVKTSRKVAFPC